MARKKAKKAAKRTTKKKSTRKPARKTAKRSSKKEVLVVASKVKETIKKHKCMTSSEFIPALSEVVHELIAKAAERAKANKRSTLRAKDL